MKSKFIAVTLAAALAAPLAMPSQGVADGGKSKSHGGPSTKLYAKFNLPAPGVTLPDEFKARVKYERKTNSKGTQEEIDAKVRLALPPTMTVTTPPASTTDTDLDTEVDTKGYLVKVLSGTTEKGICVLLAKSIELEYLNGVVSEFDFKYAAKVKEKTNGTSLITSRVGDCWVAGVRGVPDVMKDDIVELYSLTFTALPLTGPPTLSGTALLTGSFQPGYDHGDDEDDDD